MAMEGVALGWWTHTNKYTDDVLHNCNPDTYRILLTNVTLINFQKVICIYIYLYFAVSTTLLESVTIQKVHHSWLCYIIHTWLESYLTHFNTKTYIWVFSIFSEASQVYTCNDRLNWIADSQKLEAKKWAGKSTIRSATVEGTAQQSVWAQEGIWTLSSYTNSFTAVITWFRSGWNTILIRLF